MRPWDKKRIHVSARVTRRRHTGEFDTSLHLSGTLQWTCLAEDVVLIEPLDTNWTTESWSNFMGWFHRGSMQTSCVFSLFLLLFFVHWSPSADWPLLEFFLSFFPGRRIRRIHKERDALTKLYLPGVYSPPTCQSAALHCACLNVNNPFPLKHWLMCRGCSLRRSVIIIHSSYQKPAWKALTKTTSSCSALYH